VKQLQTSLSAVSSCMAGCAALQVAELVCQQCMTHHTAQHIPFLIPLGYTRLHRHRRLCCCRGHMLFLALPGPVHDWKTVMLCWVVSWSNAVI
jgi:hypothetical protein